MERASPTGVVNAAPLVSVVVTTYNRAHLLGRALKSVLSQTMQDFEVIVVDDASQDDPAAVVDAFGDRRIRLVQLDSNHGAAGARGRGFAEARGIYVANLDSDDEWLPEKLERQLAVFESSKLPRLGVVYGGIVNVSEDGTEEVVPAVVRGDIQKDLLQRGYVVKGSFNTTLIRRSVLEEIGVQDLSNPCREDFDYFLRISQRYQFDCVPEPVVLITKFGGDRLTSSDRRRVLAYIRVLKRHKDLYLATPDSRYFIDHMMIAKHLAWMDRPQMAWKVYRYALRRVPMPSLRWRHSRELLVVPQQILRAVGRKRRAAKELAKGRA